MLPCFENMAENVKILAGLDRLCRTCLSEKNVEELRCLFDNSLEAQLAEVTAVKIERNDGLPSHICNDCYFTLNIAVNFKDQCQKSESELRSALCPRQTLIYKSIALLGNSSDELQIQNYEELDTSLSLLKTSAIDDNITVDTNIPDSFENVYCSDVDIDSIISEKSNSESSVEATRETVQEVVNNTVPQQIVNSTIKCTECDRTFRHEAALKSHMVKHGHKLKCEACGEEFLIVKELRDHIKLHEDYKPYVCKICNKAFSLTSSLVKHMRIHGGEKKAFVYNLWKEVLRAKSSQRKFLHIIHIRTHTGEKPILCKTCGKRFSDPHGLTTHNKIHTGERKHECNFCGKRFAHSFVLKAHKRTHTGERPYKCNTCEASFATSSYLTIHIRTHTQERPYKCEVCPKRFVSKCALAAHNKIHTGEKKFQCNVCGKRTTRSADLQIHMRSHTGEKPYICDQCPKRYHTSSNLATHKRTHLGIKDHICTICHKAFGDPRTLKCHYRIHTGERPYGCNSCGKCYTQAGQLAAHRKTHKAN
ncbi:hypothetical protein NQ318_013386 [Aromia moschata]|uniref:Uncharacterized protein n=1 Tax=Aromia moschata TaxID=1265417 RepID=A0AAV8XV01_9CUCU|nr:hypothetical protein NQ318_013386 [Aromia moschata]